MLVSLFFLFAAVAFGELAKLKVHADAIPDSYIVVYKEVEVEALLLDIKTAVPAENLEHVYQSSVKGFSAKLNAEQLATIRANPLVDYVEMDTVVSLSACSPTVSVTSWGLTRISQRDQNLNSRYAFPDTAGKGVDVYVIDTGIYTAHQDFVGRATFGFKSNSAWSNSDDNGHGTHVASTAVGIQYGVARSASVIAVRVLGPDGSGTNAGVIAGVDWAISAHQKSGKKSVINMSLGGGYSSALNTAVNSAVKAGIATVVAAGNENSNACDGSPSGAADVLTVGATNVGALSSDVRSYFSNWGPCVGVFAPGSDITAAWIGSPSAVRTISGTSMASPHVAGIAALVFSENPSFTGSTVQQYIVSQATKGKINMDCSGTCGASVNLLAYNGCTA